jgi:glycosyltransferase involved in cell wall biosynthesis
MREMLSFMLRSEPNPDPDQRSYPSVRKSSGGRHLRTGCRTANLRANMRIAVDASILELPCPTGVERAASETLRELPACLEGGDELIVFGRGVPPLTGEPTRAVRAVGLGGAEPLAVWRESRLAPALKSQGAHVLWSPVAAIPLRTSLPRVATIHELPWHVRPGIEGRLRERVHRVRLRIAARTAALLCVPSETTAGQVSAEVPEATAKVRLLPHGVGDRFRSRADGDEAARLRAFHDVADAPFLLHVGGTRARKGIPFLMRAYARYRLQGGGSPLVLAGPGAAPENAPAGVQHLGYVSDELLHALYAGARLLVVSSETEGFGLPCLEAMAQEVPVVTVNGGALPEVVGSAAIVVPAGDDDALAAALVRVEREKGFARDLAERGRERVSTATWARAARRLREILAEAVGM